MRLKDLILVTKQIKPSKPNPEKQRALMCSLSSLRYIHLGELNPTNQKDKYGNIIQHH